MATRKKIVEVEVEEEDTCELFTQAEAAVLRAIIDATEDNYSNGDVYELCQAYRSLIGG